jgi:adenine deaminase
MATINSATYYGLDAHLGAVAPGRCADVLAVDTLESFRPQIVVADGHVVTGETTTGGGVPWASLRLDYSRADITAEELAAICERGPMLRLRSVIARPVHDADIEAEPWQYAALIGRDGTNIVGARIAGLRCTNLASTQTGYRDALLIGRDPEAMLSAYDRVIASGGGLATPEDVLPLPVLGAYSDRPIAEIAALSEAVTRSAGWDSAQAPIKWVSLFLTEAVMPGWTLTPDGVLDVRTGEIQCPPVALSRRGATPALGGSAGTR